MFGLICFICFENSLVDQTFVFQIIHEASPRHKFSHGSFKERVPLKFQLFVDTFEVDYGNEYDDIGSPLLNRPL